MQDNLMRRNVQLSILCILLISIALLSGCSNSGIHLFNVKFTGEVKESSIIQQPIKGVQIYSATDQLLGETDATGHYAIQMQVKKGLAKLTFKHPNYSSQTLEMPIRGKYTETVTVPPLVMTTSNGQISGQVVRASTVQITAKQLYDTTQVNEKEIIPNEYNLVTFRGKRWLQEKLNSYGSIVGEVSGGFYTIRMNSTASQSKINTVIQELATADDVKIAPNHYARLMAVENTEPLAEKQWNMAMIKAPAAWEYSQGEGVTVAILDTLYRTKHPDLALNLLPGVDVNQNTAEDLTLAAHGMHVAGIIGAALNNYGVAGVAPKVTMLPIRIFKRVWTGYGESITASVDDIVEGINIAIENGVQVINMSLGMESYDAVLHEAIKRAYAAGITVVAASGNNGNSKIFYPAAFPEVIAVGAVGVDGKRTAYSQYGDGLELMAPGGSPIQGEASRIWSTGWDFDFEEYTWVSNEGTSMATPHVSGIVALMIANGFTDPDYIRLVLRETAHDLGSAGYDKETGYGLVDAYAVLQRFQNTYVFFGDIVSGQAQLKSKVVQVEVNGEYTLIDVHPGTGKVIGWIDVNKNLKIDGGDYLGQSASLEIKAGSEPLTNMQIKVSVVPGDFSAIKIEPSTM